MLYHNHVYNVTYERPEIQVSPPHVGEIAAVSRRALRGPMSISRSQASSMLAQAAIVRIGGVLLVLGILWLAVAWAVAVP